MNLITKPGNQKSQKGEPDDVSIVMPTEKSNNKDAFIDMHSIPVFFFMLQNTREVHKKSLIVQFAQTGSSDLLVLIHATKNINRS